MEFTNLQNKMANKTIFGKAARDALLAGMTTVHQATSMSLGARGRNAAFRLYGRPKVTNDGVRIARQIDPEDEFEKMGADMIKEAAEMTDAEAGDGTTTSTTLAYAIITEGMVALEEGVNAVQLKNEIDAAVTKVCAKLDEQAIKITDDKELENIAIISVENEELGKLIAGAAKRAGEDGSVVVEEQESPVIEREDVEGYRFDRGLMSPYLVTNPERMEAVIMNCPILVTDKTWNLNNDLVGLLEELHKQGERNILIIAEEVSGELLSTIITNKLKGLFDSVVVKKPANPDMLEDIAILTGATAMLQDKGMVRPQYSYLGWADKVISNRNSTTIIGGRGKKEAVEAKIEEIKTLIPSLDGYDKVKANERLARLTGGVSVIRIGAPTSTERGYLKLKADDAVNACKAALQDGIIPGGGAALFWIGLGKTQSRGEEIVFTAIQAPFRHIVATGGGNIENAPPGGGFNVKTLVWEEDMLKAGVIDPVKVTKSALKNAASLAGTFLTIEAATAEIPPKT